MLPFRKRFGTVLGAVNGWKPYLLNVSINILRHAKRQAMLPAD